MTELTLRPLASADDARGTSGSISLDSTMLQLSGSNILVLVRFPNATIAQGATINSATFQGYFFNTSYDTAAFTVAAAAADNPGAITETDTTPTWTTESVSVNLSDVMSSGSGFYTIADVTDIVQELVNRAGWASGNAILLGEHSLSSGESRIRSWDYDDHSYGPKLIIDYTAGAAPAAAARGKLSRVRVGTKIGGILT